MRPPTLDAIDVKILAALQRDGRSTIQKLAGTGGLSARPALERVRWLEAAGILAGYQAQLELERLSNPIVVFAEIALESHGRKNQFERRLAAIEEIVECWEVSGAFDYLARVVCADVARYEALTAALIDDPKLGIARIVSLITLPPRRGCLSACAPSRAMAGGAALPARTGPSGGRGPALGKPAWVPGLEGGRRRNTCAEAVKTATAPVFFGSAASRPVTSMRRCR